MSPSDTKVTVEKEFISANILGVAVEHNGYVSGDSGGYVEITITDLASTNMKVNGAEAEKFILRFEGQTERDTFTRAFEFIVKVLNTDF